MAKTGRPEYDEAIAATGLFEKDEPIFILRPGDITAPQTVRYWAHMAWANGADKDGIVQRALDHADAMEAWQKEHGRKIPDLPGEGSKTGEDAE